MSRRYPGEDFDDHVDRVTADETQREIDNREELLAAQRRASGISKEELALIHAGNLGAQAGAMDLPAGLNPYPLGTSEYVEWDRRRVAVSVARLNNFRRVA